nr:putative reverse transcriptase domain-containing protein [Tanacetum cinerariifolium]
MVACLEKIEENVQFHQIVDFLSTCSINYVLTTSMPLDIGADEAVHQEGVTVWKRAITIDASLVAAQESDNIAKTQSKATSIDPISQETTLGVQLLKLGLRLHLKDPPLSIGHTIRRGDRMEQETDLTDFIPLTPYDLPLLGGHTPGSNEGRPNLLELMNICTKLSNRVLALEEAKTTQDKVITILKLRVRRLEKKRKARTSQLMKRRLFKGRVKTSTDKSLEDKDSSEKSGSSVDQVSTARPEVSAATPSAPPPITTIFGGKEFTIAQTLITILLKSQGFPGQNKTLGPWSAHIPMWQLFKRLEVKWIKNGAKASIYGFVEIKSAYYSKSRQSRKKSPSMPLDRAQKNDFNAMIDQAIQRNPTHTQDDASQSSGGGLRRPVQPARHEAAYAMTWGTLKKKMTEKYCPKGKFKKLEIELWNLSVKGNDVAAYTQRFQKQALRCTKFLADETEKVEKYISGLLDNIHGNVMSARPKTLNETIELANELMDQKLHTYTESQSENKKKVDDSLRINQQQPHKKQNVARRTLLALVKRRNGIAQGRAYVLGGRDASPNSNVIMGTFLLNNRYAKILFDTGADRSFVSTTFSNLIDITPTTLENHYGVELADGKIIRVNTIVCGCTLNFMNHPFNIDLMHVPLGSFDVIIGMDWLTKYHGVIICDEKIVCVPFGIEIFPCDVFLAQITMKEAKDKSEGKRLEDVPIVRDFPEVFLQTCRVFHQPDKLNSKSIWYQFLGHMINSKGIHMDPTKIESIKDWVSPKNPIEIRQFLGLAGYYRRFIEGFLKTTKLMTKLTQKNVKFDWGEKEEAAFQLSKQKLCSTPILALPKGSENFIVYCDASHKGLGAVLM